jgi:hypothetical protein
MPDNLENQRRWRPRTLHIPKALQQEADQRAGDLLLSLLDQTGKAEVETLIGRGKHALAMRRVRELTGLRLLDAKRVVDSLQRPRLPPLAVRMWIAEHPGLVSHK